jgi:hypothetical protein
VVVATGIGRGVPGVDNAAEQPCITEEGNCDLCGRKAKLADEEKGKETEK